MTACYCCSAVRMPCLLAVIQLTAIYCVPLCTHLVIDRSRPQLTIVRSILSSATTVDCAVDHGRPRSICTRPWSIVRSTAVDHGRLYGRPRRRVAMHSVAKAQQTNCNARMSREGQPPFGSSIKLFVTPRFQVSPF
jgi:hypothetical protein